MQVSERLYEELALREPNAGWELVCGRLRRKPAMTIEHNDLMRTLLRLLIAQLDHRLYAVDMNTTKARSSSGTYYIPDLCVIPRSLIQRLRHISLVFEVYADPLPLVIEVWSPSTGEYDVEDKLREYQTRGDEEIWRVHPYERTLTAWRKQSDGTYTEAAYAAETGVIVPVTSLPGVQIALDELFE